MKAEEDRSAEGPMRGSRPDNRMKPRRDDSEFIAIEFDSTLGNPGEGPPRVPDLGSMDRCNVCDLAPQRVSRGGNAGKCERCKKCEKKRHGDGEMQGVCVENIRGVPQPRDERRVRTATSDIRITLTTTTRCQTKMTQLRTMRCCI